MKKYEALTFNHKGECIELGHNSKAKEEMRSAGVAYRMARFEDGTCLPIDDEDLLYMYGTKLACYRSVIKSLERDGFYIKMSKDGYKAFSGHIVSTVSKPPRIKGINFPDKYKVLRPISHSDQLKVATLNERLHKKIDTITLTATDLEEKEGYSDEVPEVKSDPKDVKPRGNKNAKKNIQIFEDFDSFNREANAIGNSSNQDVDQHKVNKIDLDGIGKATKYIPKLDWFDEKITKNINAEMLLSLLRPAERESFLLFLGRTACGRLGQEYTIGSPQFLKWRSLIVWVGSVGGLGKSSFLEYLTTALRTVGFTGTPFPNDLSRPFGLGSVAESDLAFMDDCSGDSIFAAVGNPCVKSLVSGTSDFVSEKKGVDHAVTKSPTPSVFLLTNSLPLDKMSQLDGGNLSRLTPMRTINPADREAREFTEKYSLPLELDQAWEYLAKKYDVSVESLALYLIRLGVDMFRAIKTQKELVEKLTEQKSRFSLRLEVNHNQQLMQHYLHLCKLWNTKPNRFDPSHMLEIFRITSTVSGVPWSTKIPGCEDKTAYIMELIRECKSKNKSAKTITLEFFQGIRSETGMPYSTYLSTWVDLFRECENQIDAYSEPEYDAWLQELSTLSTADRFAKEQELNILIGDANRGWMRG